MTAQPMPAPEPEIADALIDRLRWMLQSLDVASRDAFFDDIQTATGRWRAHKTRESLEAFTDLLRQWLVSARLRTSEQWQANVAATTDSDALVRDGRTWTLEQLDDRLRL